MKKLRTVRTFVIFAVLFALLFVVISPVLCNDTHHDCTGEDCFICLAVSSVRENYDNLMTWNQALSFALVLCLSLTAFFVVSNIDALIITPIKLKVKLSN
jgi:F0F1-type ATP synthase membrane subunit a